MRKPDKNEDTVIPGKSFIPKPKIKLKSSRVFPEKKKPEVRPRKPRRILKDVNKKQESSKKADFHSVEADIRFPSLRSILWNRTPICPEVILNSADFLPTLCLKKTVLASLYYKLLSAKNEGHVVPLKNNPLFQRLSYIASKSSNFIGDYFENDSKKVSSIWELYAEEMKIHEINKLCDYHSQNFFGSHILCKRSEEDQIVNIMSTENEHISELLEDLFDCNRNPEPFQAFKFKATGISHADERISLKFVTALPKFRLHFRAVLDLPILATPLSRRVFYHKFNENSKDNANSDFLSGLLTLNQSRKAVLLMEDDPFIYQTKIPVVGAWVKSNIFFRKEFNKIFLKQNLRSIVQSPEIFTICLRYIFNELLPEKVCPSETEHTTFLLLIYLNGKEKQEETDESNSEQVLLTHYDGEQKPEMLFIEIELSIDENDLVQIFSTNIDVEIDNKSLRTNEHYVEASFEYSDHHPYKSEANEIALKLLPTSVKNKIADSKKVPATPSFNISDYLKKYEEQTANIRRSQNVVTTGRSSSNHKSVTLQTKDSEIITDKSSDGNQSKGKDVMKVVSTNKALVEAFNTQFGNASNNFGVEGPLVVESHHETLGSNIKAVPFEDHETQLHSEEVQIVLKEIVEKIEELQKSHVDEHIETDEQRSIPERVTQDDKYSKIISDQKQQLMTLQEQLQALQELVKTHLTVKPEIFGSAHSKTFDEIEVKKIERELPVDSDFTSELYINGLATAVSNETENISDTQNTSNLENERKIEASEDLKSANSKDSDVESDSKSVLLPEEEEETTVIFLKQPYPIEVSSIHTTNALDQSSGIDYAHEGTTTSCILQQSQSSELKTRSCSTSSYVRVVENINNLREGSTRKTRTVRSRRNNVEEASSIASASELNVEASTLLRNANWLDVPRITMFHGEPTNFDLSDEDDEADVKEIEKRYNFQSNS